MFDLSGRVAVVTGGNGGIGLGIARGLAEAGAAIAIWARNADKNETAVKELEGLGVKALALPCDVSDEAQVADVTAKTVEALGRIDICVANAGFGFAKSTLKMTLEEWRQVTSVDLDGVFLTFREVAKHMIERGGGGKLIAISSIGEIYGMARQVPYARDLRHGASGALRREQGRPRRDGALARGRARPQRHPGERCPARLDRDGCHAAPARMEGDARHHRAPHPGAALGQTRRHGGRVCLPRLRRGSVPHRRHPARRRRLLGLLVSGLPETGLVRLDANDRAQIEAFAQLHELTLPESVPVKFGRRFMTRFYFPKLVGDGAAAGDLFRCEGRWAGYNFYTKTPRTLLRDAVRRHFLFLCGLMPGVLLANPRALLAIPKMLHNQGGFPEQPRTGYFLTFGVHPDFRGRSVSGKKIATHLMERMFDYFREEGFEAVEATVERSNERAMAFYRSCGFEVQDRGFEAGAQLQIRYPLGAR
jgi:ribosomal protein S18 acetylase RimI-like enzyme